MGVFKKGETWFIDYYHEGRRIREKAGSNKAAAKQALAKRQTEVLEGKFFLKKKEPQVSFKEFASYYWDLHGKYKRTSSYKSMLRLLVAEFGEMPLSKFSVPMILTYRNKVRERASTVAANRHLAFLRSMLYKAIQWEKYVGENPAAKIKLERENNHRVRFLSEQEIQKLLANCSPRIFPVVACALLTGMRMGEILKLSWENVDLEHGIVYVLNSKSGKPREIPIAAKLDSVIRSLGPKQRGSIFEMPEITLRRHFPKALKASGIDDFRFHDLRHTFASHYIMQTGDLPSLQKLLGHSTPTMTQRYAHLAANHLRAGIERFNAAMDTFWTPSTSDVSRPS